jgi:hypothetical protein
MAESTGNPELQVNIGGDISQLQASIIAAENELRGFQAEIKKTTDTGKIAELSAKIETTTQRIAGMRQEMGKSAGASDKAVNALGNVSRVAQDASYGFMGIANNLNPLFESFQRLQKESGGTGNALKAMGAALTGPAGIGLAIGVASSLIVTFGDDIADFVKSATGGTKALVEFGKAFSGAKDAFTTAYVEMENLNSSFDQFHNGTKSKKSVLDEYNSSLGKVYGTTKDIAEAEKLFIENKDNYVQAALYRAAGQIALKKAAEEAFKQLEAQNAPQNANKTSLFMGEGLGALALSKLTGGPALTYTDLLGSTVIAGKAAEQEKLFKGIFDQFQKLADEQDKLAKHSKDFGKEITDGDSDFKIMAKQELQDTERWVAKLKQNLKESQEVLKNERIKLFTLPSEKREDQQKRGGYFDKQIKELTDQSNEKGLGAFLMKDAKSRIKEYDAEEKKVKELAAAYENFANMLASNLTSGIMDVFAAFEAGTNPLEAIADMFLNIAKSIAAAVIQATIFEAILTAFPELKAIFAASGALQSAFGGKKLAAGGITNGASIAMIGEAGPEAVLPLSRLNTFMQTSFNAGAMSGGGRSMGGSSVAVLRGQDLLVAINRTQKSSSLKGQNISLI